MKTHLCGHFHRHCRPRQCAELPRPRQPMRSGAASREHSRCRSPRAVLGPRRCLCSEPFAQYRGPWQPHGISRQHARCTVLRHCLSLHTAHWHHLPRRGTRHRHPRCARGLSRCRSPHGAKSHKLYRLCPALSHLHRRRQCRCLPPPALFAAADGVEALTARFAASDRIGIVFYTILCYTMYEVQTAHRASMDKAAFGTLVRRTRRRMQSAPQILILRQVYQGLIRRGFQKNIPVRGRKPRRTPLDCRR